MDQMTRERHVKYGLLFLGCAGPGVCFTYLLLDFKSALHYVLAALSIAFVVFCLIAAWFSFYPPERPDQSGADLPLSPRQQYLLVIQKQTTVRALRIIGLNPETWKIEQAETRVTELLKLNEHGFLNNSEDVKAANEQLKKIKDRFPDFC